MNSDQPGGITPDPVSPDLFLDPLREVTRKERRNLLASSAIAIAIVKTGLVPEAVPAVGIKFSQSDKSAFLSFLLAVVIYFLIAFIIYSFSDFVNLNWKFYLSGRKRLKAQMESELAIAQKTSLRDHEIEEQIDKIMARKLRNYLLASALTLRVPFDFVVPLGIGVYAIWTLIVG